MNEPQAKSVDGLIDEVFSHMPSVSQFAHWSIERYAWEWEAEKDARIAELEKDLLQFQALHAHQVRLNCEATAENGSLRTALAAQGAGEPDGWAMLDKDGVTADFRPRVREFFGATLTDNAPEFDPEEISKRDREWAGLAPHRCVEVFYTRPPAPERAEVLKDAEIREGWKATFSTQNPYCPITLESFTKAVRWTEHAAIAKEKQS